MSFASASATYEASSVMDSNGNNNYQERVSSRQTANSGRENYAASETIHSRGSQSLSSATAEATSAQIAADLLQLNRLTHSSLSNRAASSHSNQVSVSAALVSAASSNNGNPTTYLSEVEAAILRSNVPINVNETEEITVLGQRGIWTNKAEVVNWKGVIPITQYQINEDANPEIITKRTDQRLEYVQELAIRYLRPPTPPAPGEILIQQECNSLVQPAPPLIIRQQPPRPCTPEPLVIREAPPKPPCQVGRKVITISGKRLPPPPRKVVIERLAPLPSKPQAVLIERWLPYSQVKRRVIFQKSCEGDAVAIKPRNVIIQWEAPQVVIKKDFKYLGIIRANPVEYVQRYGATLKSAKELPDFVLEIKPPAGVTLAADYQYNSVHELEGDLQALRLVDLDREGLAEYRAQLQRIGISYNPSAAVLAATTTTTATSNSSSPVGATSSSFEQNSASVAYSATHSVHSSLAGNPNAASIIADIFDQVDADHNGRLSREEAEKILLRVNSRLNRRYGEDDVSSFFQTLDTNQDGSIDLNEFKVAFERLL